MAILQNREKKIDLSRFFNNEEAYIYIKYINRDIWRYINRLTLKSIEATLYSEIINDKEYKKIKEKLENCNLPEEKIKLNIELNRKAEELMAEKYQKIDKNKVKETFEIENERNKLLIDNGVDFEKHNFTNEKGEKIELNYNILKDCVFFDFLLEEIMKYNGDFNVGELKLKT